MSGKTRGEWKMLVGLVKVRTCAEGGTCVEGGTYVEGVHSRGGACHRCQANKRWDLARTLKVLCLGL